MQASTLAVTAARARIAIGIVMVAVPGRASRLMGGEHGDDGSAPVFLRMLGARDIALGLGTVVALDRGAPVRGWLEGSALADAGDVVASVLGRDRLTPNGFIGTAGIAAASTVLGALLARRLDPPPPPDPGHPEAIATGHHPATDAAEPPTG
jgi:hypothetical protein